jgi:hypothetical protein
MAEASDKEYKKSALHITTLAHNVCGQALVFLVCIRVVPLPKFYSSNMLQNADRWRPTDNSKTISQVHPYFVHPCIKEEYSSRDPLHISLCSDCSAYVQRSISSVRTALGRHVCVYSACVDLSVWSETGQYPEAALGQVRKTWPTEYRITWRKDNLNN